MKKMLILTALSVSLFGMNQESHPNTEIAQEKYQELQGHYTPQIGYFTTKFFSCFPTNQPFYNITSSLNLTPQERTENSNFFYKQQRVMSYGFEPKERISFETIFNRLKDRDSRSMENVTMDDFSRKTVKENDKIMIWQNEKSKFPVAIIEYLK